MVVREMFTMRTENFGTQNPLEGPDLLSCSFKVTLLVLVIAEGLDLDESPWKSMAGFQSVPLNGVVSI